MFVGNGPLFDDIKALAEELGISDKCFFLGVRSDVPALLKAMDVFLLPSHREGVPLVLMETQAAGLPCVCSDVITEDVLVVKELALKVSLKEPVSVWADTILEASNIKVDQVRSLEAVKQSAFNIESSMKTLEKLYGTCGP